MTISVDPESNETRAVRSSDFTICVLEIVRWTPDMALCRQTAYVMAIDPFENSIVRAKENMPDNLKNRVEFRHIAFEDFAAASKATLFDIAILSWSLC
jgi:hypothetical protein